MKKLALTLAFVGFASMLGSVAAQQASTETVPMQVFTPAGAFGGGGLTAGAFYPPASGDVATLTRRQECVSHTISTTGLPPGAYTNWWVVYNNPSACTSPDSAIGSKCGLPDLLVPGPQPAVYIATGNVVGANGVGSFQDRHCVGNDLGIIGQQNVLGTPYGVVNTQGSEIHLIVKYHGVVPSDTRPGSRGFEEFRAQTTSLLGLCGENANAIDFGPPFGVQCFDPQIAVFSP